MPLHGEVDSNGTDKSEGAEVSAHLGVNVFYGF